MESGSVTFGYTGNVQIFNPNDYGLVTGDVITLEVWGARGETGKASVGDGGYSYGRYTLNGNSLYVYVGGINGYNGGGNGYSGGGNGGGGTDIKTSMNDNYNYRIIVAGGGGGGGGSEGSYSGSKGGNGGIKGTAEDGSFGKGGSANTSHGGGGGGGYYGGGSANGGWNGAGGGGGSGYCGISECDGENGANGSDTEIDGVRTNGNGYAKISW